ncbi:hypothetical protein TNCV_1074361 [Trichonephila clavipes]|uniref:Uncharacterized protein n=1 Tax=Trichonephila clavipes TaxID=2585209 RepID=A0A8X6SSZ7_TRICX|nr:hypothetical protein TNCV_1074361 [Trichonephila clavipes]
MWLTFDRMLRNLLLSEASKIMPSAVVNTDASEVELVLTTSLIELLCDYLGNSIADVFECYGCVQQYEKNTKRYIDVVDKLVYSYNNTWHRSIQMTPASVTETNQSQVWENLYDKQNNKSYIIPHSWNTVRNSFYCQKKRLQNFVSEQLSELDEKMQSILRNKNMNDSEKVTLYLQILRKYVNFPFPKEINEDMQEPQMEFKNSNAEDLKSVILNEDSKEALGFIKQETSAENIEQK